MHKTLALAALPLLLATADDVAGQAPTHANVGALMIPDGGGNYVAFSSGTLIHPEVFLTAGHATSFLDFLIHHWGGTGAFPMSAVYVTFEPQPPAVRYGVDPIPAAWKPIERLHTHPGFFIPTNAGETWFRHDVGAIVLRDPETTIAPAVLPGLGYFSRPNNVEHHMTPFTLVGYGATVSFAPWTVTPGGIRREQYPQYLNHWHNLLLMQGNPAASNPGGCFGDSGGPVFVDIGGVPTLIAIASGGGPGPAGACFNYMLLYRMDLAAAQGFVADVIAALP